jgi:hypothetical protein
LEESKNKVLEVSEISDVSKVSGFSTAVVTLTSEELALGEAKNLPADAWSTISIRLMGDNAWYSPSSTQLTSS